MTLTDGLEEYHLALKVADYLPRFTPMSCKHCKHAGCNRKRERGVCDEYEVEPLKSNYNEDKI